MTVLAFAEQREGSPRQVAFETVTAGRQLSDSLGVGLAAVILGPPTMAGAAERLGTYGADEVLVGSSEAFREYSPEGFSELLASVIQERDPQAVLFPASALGKDLAPRVAARLKMGLASDVTDIGVEDGRIVVVRPVYAGKVHAKVAFVGQAAMLSIRPRAFQPLESPRDAQVTELATEIDPSRLRARVRRVEAEKMERPDVAEAEIIVSGGRGMQGPENWRMLEELVDALGSGATLGASRAVVDAGWRPHAEQVGQTGKVVSPKLYFAIGISGAIQHQAGMRTATCIVAVNKDGEAPIFKLADYGVVGDLFEIVPRLTEGIQKLRSED